MIASGEAGLAGQSMDLRSDRERALALTPVSRETAARLDRFVELLLTWQQHTNLIARSTIPIIWTRHVADSLQLLDLAPGARIWADLGSGAGFPGLVIACALADATGAHVHLVESIGKKARFLREAVRVTGAPATIHAVRVEEFARGFVQDAVQDFVDNAPKSFGVITARALAPLPELLDMAYPLLKGGAVGLFPKGQDVAVELTEAAKCWNIQSSLMQSRTDSKGQIVIVHSLEPARRALSRPPKRGNRRR
jgi:16S rRNA (guanine527-N7)-methyltransferase